LAGGASRKVLVVDDVSTNRELLAETLTRAGFEIRAASSGEEALDAHEAWQPDLIVTDLHMPGMGGLDAIRVLRQRGSSTPVVVATASTDETTRETVRSVGAQRLLRKPHRERELLDTIAELLNVELIEVEAVAPAAVPATPVAPVVSLTQGIPAAVITELVEAARKARAARILELAAEVERHSPGAAERIRQLADSFSYSALLEALGGNDPMATEPRGSVLIVDDTVENLRLLVGILGDRGYEPRPSRMGPKQSAPRNKNRQT